MYPCVLVCRDPTIFFLSTQMSEGQIGCELNLL